MIRKLNNKGMTAIEILITFVIVVIIVVSMYDGILGLKTRESVASYKLSLVTYKNLLTKEIQDDLIKIGLTSTSTESMKDASGNAIGYRVRLTLRDGSIRILEVKQVFGCNAADDLEANDLCGMMTEAQKNQNDDFSISYGPEGNLTEYPLPDLGHEDISNYNGTSGTHRVYSLRINEVDVSNANQVFSVRIVLYHPDLGSRYSIDIAAPINFSGNGVVDNTPENVDPPSIPTAELRRENSTGTVLNNTDTWRAYPIWFGNFNSIDYSGTGINRYEYSDGCTGSPTGILKNAGETYSKLKNVKYCIRAVDNTGKISDWSSPYYIKVDQVVPTPYVVEVVNERAPMTCDHTTAEMEAGVYEPIQCTLYAYDPPNGFAQQFNQDDKGGSGIKDEISYFNATGPNCQDPQNPGTFPWGQWNTNAWGHYGLGHCTQAEYRIRYRDNVGNESETLTLWIFYGN